MKIPKHILETINTLLAPSGVSYDPDESSSGYLSMKDAAAYLGVSKSFFYRLVASGKIASIKLTPGQRGKVVYAKSALDAYIASR